MEAYEIGLGDKLAMWAQKTYKGHRMPPAENILVDYSRTHATS